jgi:aldehyde dehydrogenase (NAD+)
MQEEIFGPVASIAKFKTVEEAIELGNKTTFGLASAVHTKNLETALTIANNIKAGTVWVNTYNMLKSSVPFGGFKESGIGRELGKAALANYTQTKSVLVNMNGSLF